RWKADLFKKAAGDGCLFCELRNRTPDNVEGEENLSVYRATLRSRDAGRALRGGRLPPSRNCRTSIFNSVMVRLRVLRCMPNWRAARHWFPLFSWSTVSMNFFLNSLTASA